MKTLLTTFLILIAGTVSAQTMKAIFTADTARADITISSEEWIGTGEGYDTTDNDLVTEIDNRHSPSNLILVFNRKTQKIDYIDERHFCPIDASLYLAQSISAVLAYKWMRKNRPQYSMLETVRLVNAWHDAIKGRL